MYRLFGRGVRALSLCRPKEKKTEMRKVPAGISRTGRYFFG